MTAFFSCVAGAKLLSRRRGRAPLAWLRLCSSRMAETVLLSHGCGHASLALWQLRSSHTAVNALPLRYGGRNPFLDDNLDNLDDNLLLHG